MNFFEKYGLKIILILFLTFSYSITAESKKLLILGDSISAGYGLKESENWVQLLEVSLKTSGKELQIINSSISGDTTIGGLSRIENDLKQYRPNYVLVELGGNYALRGYPIDKIKHNLIKIGSSAPDYIFRTMYENAYLSGDISNKNDEILLHNWSKEIPS